MLCSYAPLAAINWQDPKIIVYREITRNHLENQTSPEFVVLPFVQKSFGTNLLICVWCRWSFESVLLAQQPENNQTDAFTKAWSSPVCLPVISERFYLCWGMCSTLYQPLEVLLYVFHSSSAEPQGPWQEVRALGPSQVFPMCVLRPGQCPMLHGHVAFCIPQNMMLFKVCMDVSLISFPSQASLDCLFPKCYQFRKQ